MLSGSSMNTNHQFSNDNLMEKNTVQMTDAELEQFRAFQKEQQRKAEEERRRQMRTDYKDMVDREIEAAIPRLMAISDNIRKAKAKVFEDFSAIIDLKKEIFRLNKGGELEVQSHKFTNSEGDKRITLGVYYNDGYLDTAEEGIAMITEYLQSLATDEKSSILVGMVMKLLAKDQKGTLKASRIIQLRRIAEKEGDERFIEGVRIIEEAYNPTESKTWLRAEYKDESGAWHIIPLGMTEA